MKITKIKADAIVSIKIGTGFLQNLQKVMIDLISDKSVEDLDQLKLAIEDFEKNKVEFSEQWMESIHTLTVLIKEIESALIKEGHTYEEEIGDDIVNLENN
jgi:hypothetical protein